jgi:transcriptional regulator with XRE-family HTH domain
MPDPTPLADPTIHRRRLRSELRRAREAAGFAQSDVATAMDWSLSKLLRIETGAVGITTNDLKALLTHYGITDADRIDGLIAIAKMARERSRWSAYKDLGSPEFIAYLSYESAASVMRSFQPLLVPGLLQTEEYAREVLHGRAPDSLTVDRLVDLRMSRQEILERESPPSLHFIMDEAVVHRAVGGPNVMRRQLRRIEELAQQPHITVRIVPFSVGFYQRLRIAYTIFEFADPANENVLFIENPQGDMVVHEASTPGEHDNVDPVSYMETFFRLEQIARREDAPGILGSAVERLSLAPMPQAEHGTVR